MDGRKKYTHDDVMLVIAEFVIREMSEKDFSIPMELLYEDIIQYASVNYPDVPMPKFSQARKMVIADLKEAGVYSTGERLTAKVLFRLCNVYYDDADVETVLQREYNMVLYAGNIIICTIDIPPDDIIKKLMLTISENKGKSKMWGKINTIQQICKRIKDRDPENILAVIPETNRMIYLNEKGQVRSDIVELEPICRSLCMFVKDTPEGHALIEGINSQS